MFVSPSSSINFQSVVSPIPPPQAWRARLGVMRARADVNMIIAESVPREAHNRFTDNFQTDNLIFIELSQLLSGEGA